MARATRKKPFRVALTGGIASGKSTVADMFAELGAAIIDTDIIAREVVEPGQPALGEIRERFGKSVTAADGNLDRRALRKIVFADEDARHDLEAILHPRIGAETRRQAEDADGPYQIIVVPLLLESPLREFVNRIVVVNCDDSLRIRRVMTRDSETAEQARRILAAQSSRGALVAMADDVINNDGDLDETRNQVRALHERFLRMAKRT